MNIIEQIVRIETDGNDTKAEVIGELVRCKDCRKWCICHHSDDYFCADGERKETEDATD